MRRTWLQMTVVCLSAALLSLGLGGCAKKQIREESATRAPTTTAAPEATPAPAPRVGEEKLAAPPGSEAPAESARRAEPPPTDTPAVARAPERSSADRAGMAGETAAGLTRIHFDFDKAVLGKEAQELLKKNASYLAAHQGVRVRIEGHCDERGTTEYNLALGERRAKAAHQYLMDLGVDPNRMAVVSYGEEQPLDPAHNETAWAKNRRAEFVEVKK